MTEMAGIAPSPTYMLFEQAIAGRKQIACVYKGGHRELCPHILGHSNGEEVALTYQFAGTNSRGLRVRGGWKCLHLSQVENPTLRDGSWHGRSEHTQGQNCVQVVDLDVNPDSPYAPRHHIATRHRDFGASKLQAGPRTAGSSRQSRDAWIRALQATSTIAVNPKRLLADIIDDFAATQGAAPALVSDTQSLTYSDITELANRYSRWAREHLEKGDVVCLVMPNRPQYIAIWLGITRVGSIVALINTNLLGPSLAHAIATAAPKHVIVAAELEERLREACPHTKSFQTWIDQPSANYVAQYSGAPFLPSERPLVSIHDTALLIYTSGTTGLPKAAKVTHYRIMQWSLWFAGLGDFRASDRMYNCLPMYHSIGGVAAVGSVLAAGGCIIVAEKFSASRFWTDIARWECTLFQYIGELCRYLLNVPPSPEERKHRLRLCCGNGLRADIWSKFKDRFAIPQIIEFYAASEGTFSLFNIEDEPGAIGHVPAFLAPRFPAVIVRYDAERQQPYRDEQGRCVRCGTDEIGEALGRISGNAENFEARFDGYASAAETERKILRNVFEAGDAWYRTGDLMRMDARGFIYFGDRVGDTFRWKGENVSTLEVAGALASCPGVRDVVVYGVNVPGAEGRAGMAAITVEASFSLQTFRSLAKSRLPAYARPLFVRLCGDIDLTETFKPKKQVLMSEGFDLRRIAEPIYVEDAAHGAYIRLDERVFEKIQSGEFRL